MSGHSKWASIKHKKALIDAKRGKMFTKVIKEITVAAREGGDPNTNPRLRTAILAAKASNMPSDNITRAIKKGTGEIPGVNYEAVTYEGYGPGGTAVMIETLTDNKNRTFPEIRKIFERHGGNLGAAGCVAWMFTRKGIIRIGKTGVSEDDLMGIVLDAGAADMDSDDEEAYTVYTGVPEFEPVKQVLEQKKIAILSSELAMVPNSTIAVDGSAAGQVMRLMEELDDHDDVQNVYSNFDIPENAGEA